MPIKFSNQSGRFPNPPSYRTFKERKNLNIRKAEYATLKAKFPNKVMVVVERYAKERHLPILDKTKFLVPEDLCASKLMMIIRSRMNLSDTQAVCLMTSNKTLINMTKTVSEIHQQFKDEDGFVYITYASRCVSRKSFYSRTATFNSIGIFYLMSTIIFLAIINQGQCGNTGQMEQAKEPKSAYAVKYKTLLAQMKNLQSKVETLVKQSDDSKADLKSIVIDTGLLYTLSNQLIRFIEDNKDYFPEPSYTLLIMSINALFAGILVMVVNKI